MIPVAAGLRIWIASGHTDMRKGMNGLALLVQEGLYQISSFVTR
jgi:transposase